MDKFPVVAAAFAVIADGTDAVDAGGGPDDGGGVDAGGGADSAGGIDAAGGGPDAADGAGTAGGADAAERPGKPVLKIESGGGSGVVAGVRVKLVCTSEGGRPPPNVTMYKRGEMLAVDGGHEHNLSTARAQVQVTKVDNGADVLCLVSNPATPTPMAAHTTLNVHFPVSEVRVWVRPTTVDAGHTAILICETSSSSPPASVTWYSYLPLLQATVPRHTKLLGATSDETKLQEVGPPNTRLLGFEPHEMMTFPEAAVHEILQQEEILHENNHLKVSPHKKLVPVASLENKKKGTKLQGASTRHTPGLFDGTVTRNAKKNNSEVMSAMMEVAMKAATSQEAACFTSQLLESKRSVVAVGIKEQ
ncbi:uncharacterized protein [Procambarus clarkii]|uniref:uncharacterized protein n=1 Tax=Procambarus clarkii TaxID=6728 RepID=UPI0037426FAF